MSGHSVSFPVGNSTYTSMWNEDELNGHVIWSSATDVSTTADDLTSGPCGGYNWPVLFLFTIVFLAIGGNVLVCAAVKRERKLRSMFNYFLVSLALSDMMSATLVMPLSIVRAFIGNNDCLPIPKIICFTWYSLDVFFTSSTICHLCMISIDRYVAFSFPLRYCQAKNTRLTAIKIAIVWIVSFCIAGPLFVLSMLDDRQSVLLYKGCGPETQTFVISATVSSFYVPLFIMTVMYALTVHALRRQLRQQRRMIVNRPFQSPMPRQHRQPSAGSAANSSVSASGYLATPLMNHQAQRSTSALALSDCAALSGPELRSHAQSVHHSSSGDLRQFRTLPPPADVSDLSTVWVAEMAATPEQPNESPTSAGGGCLSGGSGGFLSIFGRRRRRQQGQGRSNNDNRICSNLERQLSAPAGVGSTCTSNSISTIVPSGSNVSGLSHHHHVGHSAHCSCPQHCSETRFSVGGSTSVAATGVGGSDSAIHAISAITDCQQQQPAGINMAPQTGRSSSVNVAYRSTTAVVLNGKCLSTHDHALTPTSGRRQVAAGGSSTMISLTIISGPDRGRRAVRVLGILFAVFVVFYLPFFVVYTVHRTCDDCQLYIPTSVVTAFEWLQYSGSMLNPIVYHIFNPDFRRAFHKILRCRRVG